MITGVDITIIATTRFLPVSTWCDVSLTSFTLYINNTGVMHGKLNALFSRLSDKFKTFGTVTKNMNILLD